MIITIIITIVVNIIINILFFQRFLNKKPEFLFREYTFVA